MIIFWVCETLCSCESQSFPKRYTQRNVTFSSSDHSIPVPPFYSWKLSSVRLCATPCSPQVPLSMGFLFLLPHNHPFSENKPISLVSGWYFLDILSINQIYFPIHIFNKKDHILQIYGNHSISLHGKLAHSFWWVPTPLNGYTIVYLTTPMCGHLDCF